MADVSMYQVEDENDWIIIDEALEGEPSDVEYVAPQSQETLVVHGVPGRSRFSDRNLRISTGRNWGFTLSIVQMKCFFS